MPNCVAACIQNQNRKADRHSRYVKLVPMMTGERPFEEIGMQFVSELRELEDFNAILVVIDRFTKVLYYGAATTTSTV